MTMVTLQGEFTINGQTSDGMAVDTRQKIRFNDASGIVAVVAVGVDGKPVKGFTHADDSLLNHLYSLAGAKDETIRMPGAFQ